MDFEKKHLLYVPNIITYIRILAAPFFMWIFFDSQNFGAHHRWIALGLFLFASFTDFLDGFTARKLGQVSEIGKILDPVADKILHIAAILSLTIAGDVFLAFTVILILLEVWLFVMAPVCIKLSGATIKLGANWWGKSATIILTVGFSLAFWHGYLFYIDWVIIGLGLVPKIVATSIYTHATTVQTLKALREKKQNRLCPECADTRQNEGAEQAANAEEEGK